MGRLWSCGFELQSTTSGMEWDTTTGSPTISNATIRSGAASLHCNTSSATAYLTHKCAASDAAPWWIRAYVLFVSWPGSTIPIIRCTDNVPVDTLSIRVTSGGLLQMFDDSLGTQLGSSSSALSLGTWYRIEVTIDATAGATARLDGTQFATTASALNNGQNLNTFKFGVISSATMEAFFDDLAVNDNSGTVQNSWPGAGSIVHMWPNAAGDLNDWATAVGGTAGQSNNYTRVQETPTPDDATTYNETSTSGTTLKDELNCQSSASAGIGPADTVTLVQVGVRCGSNGTTTTRNFAARVKSAASGTTTAGSTATCNASGWTTHSAASPKTYKLTSYTDPTTAVAWTPTGTNSLDNMQIGYGQVTSATLARRMSTVWALVEIVPARSFAPPPPYRRRQHLMVR